MSRCYVAAGGCPVAHAVHQFGLGAMLGMVAEHNQGRGLAALRKRGDCADERCLMDAALATIMVWC